jgi:hypothetical protein
VTSITQVAKRTPSQLKLAEFQRTGIDPFKHETFGWGWAEQVGTKIDADPSLLDDRRTDELYALWCEAE